MFNQIPTPCSTLIFSSRLLLCYWAPVSTKPQIWSPRRRTLPWPSIKQVPSCRSICLKRGTEVTAPFKVAGWASASGGIKRINFRLLNKNKKFIKKLSGIRYGVQRKDACRVHAALKDPNCPNVGWRGEVDIADLAPGTYYLRAKATDHSRNKVIRDRKFTIVEDTSPKETLIVITEKTAGLRTKGTSVVSVKNARVFPLNQLLKQENLRLELMFGDSEEELLQERAVLLKKSTRPVPDLSRYYEIKVPKNKAAALAKKFLALEPVDGAYIAPTGGPASIETNAATVNLPAKANADSCLPETTPDFTANQEYFRPAPIGLDVEYARQFPGGKGEGIRCGGCRTCLVSESRGPCKPKHRCPFWRSTG